MKHSGKELRDLIADTVHAAANDVVREHWKRRTQEHQITAKVADRVEKSLRDLESEKLFVDVYAQDLSDKGPGSQERKIGADVFVAVKIVDREGIVILQKGLLIQSKKHGPMSSDARRKFKKQCEDMRNISPKGSDVWIYKEGGISVVPAEEVVANSSENPSSLSGSSVRRQFEDFADCVRGDLGLAPNEIFESPYGVYDILEEIGAKWGIVAQFRQRPRKPGRVPMRGRSRALDL